MDPGRMPVGAPEREARAADGRRRGACAVAAAARTRHLDRMVIPPSPLDQPDNALYAWTRYKRILARMGWFTLAVVLVTLAWLYRENGLVSINLYIATALGIGGMMMLTAALMGLVFLSSGTGHDSAVVNPLDEE